MSYLAHTEKKKQARQLHRPANVNFQKSAQYVTEAEESRGTFSLAITPEATITIISMVQAPNGKRQKGRRGSKKKKNSRLKLKKKKNEKKKSRQEGCARGVK